MVTQFLWLMISGAIIGVADVIPGVSGGTMAVVLNIYDELLSAVGNFFQNWKKNLKFLIPFIIGAGAAILLFGKLVKYLLENYPMQVNFFFIGLILGSIPMIAKKGVEKPFKRMNLIPFAVGVGVMVLIFLLSPNESSALITSLTLQNSLTLAGSGFVAAVAMIIPGISGSMMLMIFGTYYSVITAVSDLNIIVLIPAAIGILVGLLLGARLISFFIGKFPQATYCMILGLILGSLFPIIRNAGFEMNIVGLISIMLLIAGAVIAFFMSRERKDIVN